MENVCVVVIDKQLHSELKKHCKKRGVFMSWWVKRALTRRLRFERKRGEQ